MPTDTYSISTAANDGCGFWSSGSWPPSFSADESNDASNELFISKAVVGNYIQENAYLRWDTSAIGSGSTISAASLLVYVATKNDTSDNYSLVGDYFDFGGEPVVSGDYVQTSSPSIFSAVDLGSITTSAVNTFTLTDLTGISKTGVTGIRLTLSANTPTQENYITIAAQEHATFQEARLQVTYTSSSAASDAFIASERRTPRRRMIQRT